MTPTHPLPRLVIAAPASGHGKTTVATGLMAALSRAGHVVSGHKVGPDYIDPGYHALATGRPGRNLDPHLVGEDRLGPLLVHGALQAGPPADVAIIEGVMGLHDGQIGGDGFSSTAHVARVTQSPVVLVVDVSHASRSIAAMVQGMVAFDPQVRVVGVILNKVGSERHGDEVCRAMEQTGVPVLGVLHRDDAVVAPSRHLGLVPAAERSDAADALDRLAHTIGRTIDLPHLVSLARSAPDLSVDAWEAPTSDVPTTGERPVVAVAGGRAFTFRYTETTEMLTALGCDVAVFDPLEDPALPDGTRALYLGGGFPEVHAAGLSANEPLRHALREAVATGVPTYAECAGLLYLCRSVDGAPMVGALDAQATMTPRLTLAYRSWVSPADTLVAAAGARVTGHEFHRTTVTPAVPDGRPQPGTPAGPDRRPQPGTPAGLPGEERDWSAAWTGPQGPAGFATAGLHASYLHTHWAGHPQMAHRFVAAAKNAKGVVRRSTAATTTARPTPVETPSLTLVVTDEHDAVADPLRWHGDREVDPSRVDVAVNTFDGPRPDWLEQALAAADVGSYPDAGPAEHALVRRHARRPTEVLATAGAAEAFALVAGLRPWRCPVVVHPQFTEPDVALAREGHQVRHVLSSPGSGFRLEPDRVPEEADLVVLGNPTNPTGVLHPARTIDELRRPGRLVVVDEAFMDGLAGEPQSLADAPRPGVLVVRSLTKLWSIPGVRAGYVLGDADTVAALRARQTPWSVSAAAVAATIACSSERARAETAVRATALARHRAVLTDGLTELGIPHVDGPAPFVLARTGPGMHARLHAAGFAARRADTFPGLDDSWLRLSVRRPDVTRKLLATLRMELT